MRKVRLAVASAALLFGLAGGAIAQSTSDSSSDKGVLNPLLDLLLGHPRRPSDVPPPPESSSSRATQKPKPKKVAAKPATAVAAQNKPPTRPLGTIVMPQQTGTGVAARNLLPLTEAPAAAPPPMPPMDNSQPLAPPVDAEPAANAIPVAPPADAIPLAPPPDAAPAADAAPSRGDAIPPMNPAINAAPAAGSPVFPPTTASADPTALPAVEDPSRAIGLPATPDNQTIPAAPSSDGTQQQAANNVAPTMAQDDSTTPDGNSGRSLLTRVLGGFGGAIVAGVLAWFMLGFGPQRDYAAAEAAPSPAPPPSSSPSPRPNKPSAKRPARGETSA
jgi:hypothetical protein